jgi:UDP-N-acetylglucosamine acyltransferase
MTLKIHPTAKVHPTAVLDGDVEIGPETTIGALTYVEGPAVIGARNKIYPHCVIGCGPEHKSAPPTGPILIGDDNVIRELTVIQRGSGDRTTEIRSRTFIMDHVHIAHDCLVDDDVTIAPNTVFAGHVHALKGCNLGVGVVIHQFSTIGAYAMVGMGAVVTKDIPPFALVTGNPARFQRFNTHGVKRAGIPEGDVRLEAGTIVCTNPAAAELFEAFKRSARRKPLPCVPARGGDEG